jgi:hypothetical protein
MQQRQCRRKVEPISDSHTHIRIKAWHATCRQKRLNWRCCQHRLLESSFLDGERGSFGAQLHGEGCQFAYRIGNRFRRLAGQTAGPVLKPVPL